VIAAEFEATLPHTVDAPRMARRLVGEWLPEGLATEELENARLLVSELVTNAVVHGRGGVTLRADFDEDRLLVEVIDDGDGFEWIVRQQNFESVGGRGLAIVDVLASRWGIHAGTTHVWFELERPGPRLGVDGEAM
jgi:anti-sigma regulatory factor (Ser/Thr protein kinase)